jgi:hypothetical protein
MPSFTLTTGQIIYVKSPGTDIDKIFPKSPSLTIQKSPLSQNNYNNNNNNNINNSLNYLSISPPHSPPLSRSSEHKFLGLLETSPMRFLSSSFDSKNYRNNIKKFKEKNEFDISSFDRIEPDDDDPSSMEFSVFDDVTKLASISILSSSLKS